MSEKNIGNRFTRRDFLRMTARLSSTLIMMPVIQACQKLGLVSETESAVIQKTSTKEISDTPSPATSVSTQSPPTPTNGTAKIAFVRTRDRKEGVRRAISLLGQNTISGKSVLLKPNFNSDDPAPASTHPDTLRSLIDLLNEMGAQGITIADRSGMGNTRMVMENLGIFNLSMETGCETLVLDELVDPEEWVLIQNDGDHWKYGFPVPRRLLNAEAIVQTCCLKPHRYGGHFTLSLKNTVGFVGKFMGSGGHNYMTELHTSLNQRLMIAETNSAYEPALIVLDGVEAFIDKGPDVGTKVWGEVIIAGTDRVAIDAVGLALLRHLGYTGKAAKGPIFAQQQIARAVALALGIDKPEKITFITDDPKSAEYAAEIHEQMILSG